MQGNFQNHPLFPMYQQMMQGKTQQQKFQTLINSAQSRGIDINGMLQELRNMGANIPFEKQG